MILNTITEENLKFLLFLSYNCGSLTLLHLNIFLYQIKQIDFPELFLKIFFVNKQFIFREKEFFLVPVYRTQETL